ncbi:MAG: CPBP family intramembrane metalloprotease, partial [Christensenellaceae bacterium]|nr:CPBP family intramembrane metalloprotease [Christensenellaceae bacterium]
MKTSENFLTNILNNKRLSRILALILLAISVFLQIISQKYLHGDWVFLTFLASEWFMLFAILIPVHLRMKGGLPAISLTKEKPFIFYGIGSGIGILIFVLFMLVAVISKVYAFNGLANPISWGMIILFAIAFIGQSAFEEVIFRGILMHFIAKRRSKLLGIIISSVVFSLVHMPGGNATVVTFINIVLISILFSL